MPPMRLLRNHVCGFPDTFCKARSGMMENENLEDLSKSQLVALVSLLKDTLDAVLPSLHYIQDVSRVYAALDNKRYDPETGEWVDVVTGETREQRLPF